MQLYAHVFMYARLLRGGWDVQIIPVAQGGTKGRESRGGDDYSFARRHI